MLKYKLLTHRWIKKHLQGDWINWINCVKGTEITVIQWLDIYYKSLANQLSQCNLPRKSQTSGEKKWRADFRKFCSQLQSITLLQGWQTITVHNGCDFMKSRVRLLVHVREDWRRNLLPVKPNCGIVWYSILLTIVLCGIAWHCMFILNDITLYFMALCGIALY